MIKAALASVKAYIKPISYALVALVLLVGSMQVKGWYDDQIAESYTKGVADTDQKWTIVMGQKDKDNQAYRAGKEAEVDFLETLLALKDKENSDPSKNGGDKQNAYLQTPASQDKGLDDASVEIYNDSLGATK